MDKYMVEGCSEILLARELRIKRTLRKYLKMPFPDNLFPFHPQRSDEVVTNCYVGIHRRIRKHNNADTRRGFEKANIF
jgi:hypothetical protein